jgi:Helicase conserved C-terminal domain/WYL domain
MSPAQVDLVEWLRQQSDADLEWLLASRPDLLHPVPSDIGVLAYRAAGRASVEIALDRFDVGALQVVEAMALSGDPTDLESVAAILNVAPDRIGPVIDRLRRAAVVWGTNSVLRLVPVVRDLMPTPANLGPPVRRLLEQLAPSRLAGLARDLDVTDVAAVLESPTSLAALLEDAPPPAREVLELLAAGPPAGRVPSARRAVDASSTESPVRWLLAHGLLLAIDDYTVVLPREVALHIRGGRTFTDLELEPPRGDTTAHKPSDVDATAAGQAFTVVRLVESLLERWGIDPPGVLRAGGLGVRELRRSARELEIDERAAALLIEVAHAAGLIAPDGETADSWMPTTGYDLWLAKSVADRWSMLVSAWLTTTRVPALVGRREAGASSGVGGPPSVDRTGSATNALGPDLDRALAPIMRREVLRILLNAPAGVAPSSESIVAALRWSWPRRGGRLRDELVGWSHEEAELLGVTGRGAASSFGRLLAAIVVHDAEPSAAAALALEPLLPRPLDHILLQADLTAVAPGPLESDLARELAMAADIESTGGATVFRFSDASIRRALDAGRSATDLHAMLANRSRTPVPQPLTYLIDDVARRHGRIRIGAAAAYLRCDDDAVLNEVLADRRVESLRLRRLAASVLVSPLPPERVAERLRELGYAPAAENPDGGLLLRRPDARRAPARPRPARRRLEFASPPSAVVTLAVRAIRGGDLAATAAHGSVVGHATSGVVPQSASTETLSVLQDAVVAGRAVWIGYLNAQGQASSRIIEPQRLAGGYLTAFDYRRDEPRTFAVHRITGVAELTGDDLPAP